MGVDVVLYRVVPVGPGRRRYVTAEVVADPDDVLLGLVRRVRSSGRTPVLDRVDPVGLLVVPADSAAHLVDDLACLKEVAGNEAEVAHVRRVDRLARRLHEDHDMELRFEGD